MDAHLALGAAFALLLLLLWRTSRPEGPAAAAESYQAFAQTSFFSALDGLRAISVLAVIWTHVTGPHTLNLLNHGNKGVDLFFAISGFLVTTLLLREHRRTGRISLWNFYVRRTLRIFPLYYAVLALYCVLVFATLRGTPKALEFWNNLPAFATYTSNWFVDLENGAEHGVTFYFAWSLATEEQFYLFWPPLLMALLAAFARVWLAAAAAMVLLAIQVLAAPLAASGLGFKILASLAPAILFGVVFAALLHDRRTFSLLHRFIGNRFAAPGAALALVALLQWDGPGLLARFVMALLVASVCIRPDTPLHPLLTWRPMAFVGTISYGMYLMHMLAANAVRKVLGHAMGMDVFVGTAILVTFMAWLSFRYFEAPILRLKSRFQPVRSAAPAEVALRAAASP